MAVCGRPLDLALGVAGWILFVSFCLCQVYLYHALRAGIVSGRASE